MRVKIGRLIVVVVFFLLVYGFYPTDKLVQARKVGHKYWKADGDDIYNKNTGNVGIGTTSPTEKLTVDGTIRVNFRRIQVSDGTTQATAASNEDDGDWTVFGTDMYSGVSGNVGIGTTNPKSNLQIGTNLNLVHDPTRGKWIAYICILTAQIIFM